MGLEINNLAFLYFGTEVDIRQSRCQHLRIDAEFFGPASRQRWPAYEKGRRTSRLERNRRGMFLRRYLRQAEPPSVLSFCKTHQYRDHAREWRAVRS
jgi:hypothetical protein